MIKVVSFDLWMTLIKSNPAFKEKRAKYVADFMHKRYHMFTSTEVASRAISAAEKFHDSICLVTRKHVLTPKDILKIALQEELLVGDFEVADEDVEVLYDEILHIFYDFPPMLTSDRIEEMLDELSGYKLAITSNTGFIYGDSLLCILKSKYPSIFSRFELTLFSDQLQVAKPNHEIFDRIATYFNCSNYEVLHVGDNLRTDRIGAQDAGLQAVLLDADHSIEDVPKFVTMKNRITP